MESFSPKAAWMRAIVFSAACWIIATVAGTTSRVFTEPIIQPDQVDNWRWWLFFGVAVATIAIAYLVIWRAGTLVFDRKRYWGPQILFGLIWGSGTGMWLATLYVLADRTGWPRWGVWLLAFTLISLFQAFWMDLYWDVYVSPEHDTPASIRRKIPTTHIPNILVTLTFLVAYDNVAIFAIFQGSALLIAVIAMRMPPWFETMPVLPANTEPGLFGLPRCKGWEGPVDDYALGKAPAPSAGSAAG
ncbi:MAG: hypothetical protein GY812_01345 [Actinomycetia bacterium]|nr:hypothetical protein [Actinomycetes bacterium]